MVDFWLVASLTDWLIDWLIDWLDRFLLRNQSINLWVPSGENKIQSDFLCSEFYFSILKFLRCLFSLFIISFNPFAIRNGLGWKFSGCAFILEGDPWAGRSGKWKRGTASIIARGRGHFQLFGGAASVGSGSPSGRRITYWRRFQGSACQQSQPGSRGKTFLLISSVKSICTQSINQSTSQSVNEATNQEPTNQSINQPVNESTNHSINQSINQ